MGAVLSGRYFVTTTSEVQSNLGWDGMGWRR